MRITMEHSVDCSVNLRVNACDKGERMGQRQQRDREVLAGDLPVAVGDSLSAVAAWSSTPCGTDRRLLLQLKGPAPLAARNGTSS